MSSKYKQFDNQKESFEKLIHHYLSPSLLLQKDEEVLEKQEIKRGGPSNKKLPSLDLHKKTLTEASFLCSRFIEKTKQAGEKKCLIITGKGYHSLNGGVLRKQIGKEIKGMVDVDYITHPTERLGGEGAWLVYLK